MPIFDDFIPEELEEQQVHLTALLERLYQQPALLERLYQQPALLERFWQRFLKATSLYADHRKRTDRHFPIIILEPVPAEVKH